jgi:hypothetical protein
MSSEATPSTPNEVLVCRLFKEVFAAEDLEVALEVANQIIHPQFVLHDRELVPNPEKQLRGVDLIQDVITSTKDFFTQDPFKVTDFTVTVEEYLAAGEDRVVTRFRVEGKLGDKALEIRGTSISLISDETDEKILECWSNWECGLLLNYLGLVKQPIEGPRKKFPPPFKW